MREVKRALRRQLIEKRRNMPPALKAAADERIFEQLVPLIDAADIVLTYVSTEIEVDTRRVLQYCFDRGIPAAVPVSGDTELTFYTINSFSQLKAGRFGILEPAGGDAAVCTRRSLCIVPALCADGDGLRLGYGRGYYDRFLSRFEGKSVIVCYADFRMPVPSEPHDKRAELTIFDAEVNHG